ncbi:hypothetical protein P4562_20750 [Lysinibacillus xylanilyticus]|uniref:hypothetical protein n=1 Tax=Lysinibacillus xylanilyticus TaxID=582475 RepID=UPI002E1BE7D3|nr:hypothetical protein [Lysinibacillus xylanilyticus]
MQIEEIRSAFQKQLFHCLDDAEKATQELTFTIKLDYHTHTIQVQTIEQPKIKRGRSKKDAVLEMETKDIVEIAYTFNQQRFDEMRRHASRFVLITTLPNECDGENMDAIKILKLYKGQINVAMNFSFLKDPVYVD